MSSRKRWRSNKTDNRTLNQIRTVPRCLDPPVWRFQRRDDGRSLSLILVQLFSHHRLLIYGCLSETTTTRVPPFTLNPTDNSTPTYEACVILLAFAFNRYVEFISWSLKSIDHHATLTISDAHSVTPMMITTSDKTPRVKRKKLQITSYTDTLSEARVLMASEDGKTRFCHCTTFTNIANGRRLCFLFSGTSNGARWRMPCWSSVVLSIRSILNILPCSVQRKKNSKVKDNGELSEDTVQWPRMAMCDRNYDHAMNERWNYNIA